ncbi:quinoprotein dehydrogenase-associated SoxYZ-like carrier [Silicimonas algicola]|uniref:Sulfur-oxidizing protein SoxY n=1 Tax=Silicimonas algicola TaxID=1826607 RepID=A0A316G2R2_9RHOB|nr:quinoprotein dehydrogenase-associated SoxYZ-like carrier [Silicimonas algicola]AZQ69100.1 quinoprotein dehydrogenase-associated SoxYZ-like carrier [Silicimonas algicola]PWK55098.1 sulfur-oxidizing protein SoxY [Silicimonas algicola]
MRLALIAAAACAATPTLAGESWDDISAALYGDQMLLAATGIIAIDAPYRTPDDSRAQMAAHVVAPSGTTVEEVTVVLDENPMPVSAVFRFAEPIPRFYFDVTMRVNGPTPLHVVARTSDGRLFVAESFVKTTGQGACAAPPGVDPDIALLTLGEMEIALAERTPLPPGEMRLASLAERLNTLDVAIDHPQHSGMQMDQITLLFTPMRYIESLGIDLEGGEYVDMTGSISLSENPQVSLSIPSGSQSVDVTMTDTEGTVTEAHKDLTGY